jgi:hypothetical protein
MGTKTVSPDKFESVSDMMVAYEPIGLALQYGDEECD